MERKECLSFYLDGGGTKENLPFKDRWQMRIRMWWWPIPWPASVLYHLWHGCQSVHQHRGCEGLLPEHVRLHPVELLLHFLLLWLLSRLCWPTRAKTATTASFAVRSLLQSTLAASLCGSRQWWAMDINRHPITRRTPTSTTLFSTSLREHYNEMDYQHLREAICGHPLSHLRPPSPSWGACRSVMEPTSSIYQPAIPQAYLMPWFSRNISATTALW